MAPWVELEVDSLVNAVELTNTHLGLFVSVLVHLWDFLDPLCQELLLAVKLVFLVIFVPPKSIVLVPKPPLSAGHTQVIRNEPLLHEFRDQILKQVLRGRIHVILVRYQAIRRRGPA